MDNDSPQPTESLPFDGLVRLHIDSDTAVAARYGEANFTQLARMATGGTVELWFSPDVKLELRGPVARAVYEALRQAGHEIPELT